MVVLSTFDGIGGCRMGLENLSIPCKYYASEIEEKAIDVVRKRFPDTTHVGDIRNLSYKNGFLYIKERVNFCGKEDELIREIYVGKIDLLTGGSPCQNFSMAGTRKGMVTKEKIEVNSLEKYLKLKEEGFEFEGQSYLFWEYVRLYNEIKAYNPDVKYLLENVKMSKKWESIITNAMGVSPRFINSSLVSAQNRERNYWTNINFPEIKDKKIKLQDIIPDAVAGSGYRGVLKPNWSMYPKGKRYQRKYTMRKDNKANCVVTSPYSTNLYETITGERKMITPEQAELLQTVDVGYTNIEGVSDTDRYKMLGNGWTIDVITEIFKGLL